MLMFLERNMIDDNALEDIRELMERHMAPELVCKGKKYPEKDHMYSYVTVAILCDTPPDMETIKAIQHFRYEKDYLLTIRGHVEGHLVLMDLSTGKAYANKVAKHLINFYEKERR